MGYHTWRRHPARRRCICLSRCAIYSTRSRLRLPGIIRGSSDAHECFVGLELCLELLLRQRPVLCLWPFGRRLRDGPCRKTEFDFLPAFIVCNIRSWNPLHAENFDLVAITTRKGIINAREAGVGHDYQLRGMCEEWGRVTSLAQVYELVECGLQGPPQCSVVADTYYI